jgi:Cu+-exporting ATPase
VRPEGEDPEAVLRLAGAVEAASEHPIAAAIASAARDRLGALPHVGDVSSTDGLGVQGVVVDRRRDGGSGREGDPEGRREVSRAVTSAVPTSLSGDIRREAGHQRSGDVDRAVSRAVVVGRPGFVADWGVSLPPELARALDEAQDAGRSAVVVTWDVSARGVIVVADAVKPTSAGARPASRAADR